MDFDQLETFLEVARLELFLAGRGEAFPHPAGNLVADSVSGGRSGAKLLDRSGGKVSVTASGKLFQKFAEEMVRSRKAMLTAIAETERVPRGEIVVGANEGTCLHILPEVFAEFKKQYPNVGVNIKRADYAKILESVVDNSVDFGVVSLPVTDTRLTVVLIHRDELVIIAPPQHPLAKKKSATIAEAAKFPLVVPKVGHTRDALENLFYERQLKPRFTMELDSSELLKRFVAADAGVGFIASSNVLEDVRANALATIPISDATVRRDLALVFRKDKALSRAALAFIDIAVKIKNVDAVAIIRANKTDKPQRTPFDSLRAGSRFTKEIGRCVALLCVTSCPLWLFGFCRCDASLGSDSAQACPEGSPAFGFQTYFHQGDRHETL